MHPMLTIAVKAARRAGKIINQASQSIDLLTVTKKSHSDYVSEVDRAAEDAILSVLKTAYPDHGILAEESGQHGDRKQSDYLWIIDPLDGTTNFLHGFPKYAISIGLAYRGVMTHAVVYDPVMNELFTASKGGGAFLNDRRIRVSKRARLEDCLIGTGFPFRDFTHAEAYFSMFRAIVPRTAGIRRPGSASLDLCYVACGRYDGFWEIGLAPWDMAAGCLLITEAGGLIGDLEGDEKYLQSGQIVAASPKIFSQLIQTIAPHLTPELLAAQRDAKDIFS
ncbi:MAG TPA: inositol monophosphatase family protein [Nitrosomonas sp.]|nr:inositol monophosphatase family protein [Nitrosomonas sp.]HQX12817.1 inositol monophosphatase family protein [Nitrosomonas sp.]HRB32827.1 inositol monophosphatase family protein [Nitrosomonas sp.]HRB45428.1 inositol monophosphatase family protein [Nitrosomonas sp.]HRB77497.1 inositol monophosphatase family protein [Nitrosomonas sp.]